MTAASAGSSGEPRLGIVVVSYGSHELLQRNLEPLADAVPALVVVVDSWSSAEERAAVERLSAARGWALVGPDHNTGFGQGMNLGVERAIEGGCTHLLLLNPDVALAPAQLEVLLAAAKQHPNALLTPRIERPDGTTWFAGGQLDLARGLTSSTPDERQAGMGRWLTAACLIATSDTWVDLGGFDPSYFMYWEDVDLTQRHLRRGGELLVVHDACAVHDVGATQGGGKSPLYCREMCRNRLRFASTHLPWATRLRWVLHAPRYAARVTTRDGRRDALRRPRNLVAALHGTFAGCALVARSMLARGSGARAL